MEKLAGPIALAIFVFGWWFCAWGILREAQPKEWWLICAVWLFWPLLLFLEVVRIVWLAVRWLAIGWRKP